MGAFTYGGRRKKRELLNEEDRDWQPVLHPIIRDASGDRSQVAVFRSRQDRVDLGCQPQESDDLIDELAGTMIQPDGEYRHKWRVGDIVIWDNRCSYHRAAGDYPPHEDRIHWRVSIKESRSSGGKLAAE